MNGTSTKDTTMKPKNFAYDDEIRQILLQGPTTLHELRTRVDCCENTVYNVLRRLNVVRAGQRRVNGRNQTYWRLAITSNVESIIAPNVIVSNPSVTVPNSTTKPTNTATKQKHPRRPRPRVSQVSRETVNKLFKLVQDSPEPTTRSKLALIMGCSTYTVSTCLLALRDQIEETRVGSQKFVRLKSIQTNYKEKTVIESTEKYVTRGNVDQSYDEFSSFDKQTCQLLIDNGPMTLNRMADKLSCNRSSLYNILPRLGIICVGQAPRDKGYRGATQNLWGLKVDRKPNLEKVNQPVSPQLVSPQIELLPRVDDVASLIQSNADSVKADNTRRQMINDLLSLSTEETDLESRLQTCKQKKADIIAKLERG